jgi:hypothetical protein
MKVAFGAIVRSSEEVFIEIPVCGKVNGSESGPPSST